MKVFKTNPLADTEQSDYPGGVFYVSPKVQKNEKPYFSSAYNNDVEWITLEEKRASITGRLKDIQFCKETDYEGKQVDKIKIILEGDTPEGQSLNIIKSCFTLPFRSIMNSLLNHNKKMNKLTLLLYPTKSGFAGGVCKIDGEKIEWKYTTAELDKYVDRVGKLVSYERLNDFLKEELESHKYTLLNGGGYDDDMKAIFEDEA